MALCVGAAPLPLGGVWELGIPLDDEVMEIMDKPDVYEHVWDDDSGATTTHASDSEDADDEWNRLVQEALAARRFSIDITALESIVGLCDPNSSRSASRRASLALSPAEADALFLPSLPPVASAIAQALEAATAPLVIKQEASFPVPAPPRATLTKKRAAPSRYSDGDDDDDDDDDVYERSSKRRAADPKPVVSIPLSSVHVSGTPIGVYTVEERQLRIQRFLEKRQRRVWRKRIKYDCRKKLADNRPRVKGRFVKRSEEEGFELYDEAVGAGELAELEDLLS